MNLTIYSLISIGQFLSGVAGCISASVPSQMSETWFPLNERTTATTLAVIANAGGGAVAFLLGNAIVRNQGYKLGPTS
jgi:hypothetical protein